MVVQFVGSNLNNVDFDFIANFSFSVYPVFFDIKYCFVALCEKSDLFSTGRSAAASYELELLLGRVLSSLRFLNYSICLPSCAYISHRYNF